MSRSAGAAESHIWACALLKILPTDTSHLLYFLKCALESIAFQADREQMLAISDYKFAAHRESAHSGQKRLRGFVTGEKLPVRLKFKAKELYLRTPPIAKGHSMESE